MGGWQRRGVGGENANVVFRYIGNHVEPGEKEVSSDGLLWTNRINTMGNLENGERSKLNTDF